MRTKQRELNIFNLSFLDVIAGAMGAFLIVMVVLIPYYKKDIVTLKKDFNKVEIERDQALEELNTARTRADAAEARLDELEFRLAEAEIELQTLRETKPQLAKALEEIESLQQQLSKFQQELEQTRQQLKHVEQEREEANARVQETEARIEQFESQLFQARKLLEQIEQERDEAIAKAEMVEARNEQLETHLGQMQESIEDSKHRRDELERELVNKQRENASLKQTIEEERKRRDTPLLVGMKWPQKDVDLDLYLIQPSGGTVGYKCAKQGNTELVFDYTQGGAGAEVVMSSRAMPGRWSICVELYSGVRETIQEIIIRASDFSEDLSGIIISGQKQKSKIAEMTITDSGVVTNFRQFSNAFCPQIPFSNRCN